MQADAIEPSFLELNATRLMDLNRANACRPTVRRYRLTVSQLVLKASTLFNICHNHCISLLLFSTFIEPQGTHMVSINQPPAPFQVDRP